MKKLFLTGVVALSLANCQAPLRTAHAAERLPEAMLGKWCYDDNISTKSQEIYFRSDGECSNAFGINLSQTGYGDTKSHCVFDHVKQKKGGVYLINTLCNRGPGSDEYIPSIAEFQIIRKFLFIKWVPQEDEPGILHYPGQKYSPDYGPELKPEVPPKCTGEYDACMKYHQ
jgi:hypothetical protein